MSKIVVSPRARPVDIPDALVHDFLFQRIQTSLDNDGDYVWMDDVKTGMKIHISEMIPNVCKVASGLKRRRFEKGDIVLFYASNYPHFFYVILAAWKCGGGVCPVSDHSTVDQLTTVLLDCKARVIVCDPHTKSNAVTAGQQSPHVKNIIVLGEDVTDNENVEPLKSYLEDDGQKCPENVSVDHEKDPVYYVYSSGTTGLPKGIMHSHRAIMGMLTQYHPTSGAGKTVLALNWYYHLSGFSIGINWLGLGYKFLTFSSYTNEDVLRAIQERKPYVFSGYPHHIAMLARDPLVDKYDCSSIEATVTGGAVMAPNIGEELQARLPNVKSVTQAYGMSECLAVSSTMPTTTDGVDFEAPMDFSSGDCVGTLSPFAEVKVVDRKTGEALDPRQKGEICIKSPCLTLGYLNRPEATADAFDKDGWLRSGDVGYYDEEHRLYFVEREKELLKYMIHQVAPASLEAILIQHPAVADVAVSGLPDEIAGEIPIGFVVRNTKYPNVTGEELQKFVADRVSDHEQLRGGVHFVDEIPRNANGKLQRKSLRDRYLVEAVK